MILNTFLKTKNLKLTKFQKSWLGVNINLCFRSKYTNFELKKVNISENGYKIAVNDYPKEFLNSEIVNKIIKRFLKKYVKQF